MASVRSIGLLRRAFVVAASSSSSSSSSRPFATFAVANVMNRQAPAPHTTTQSHRRNFSSDPLAPTLDPVLEEFTKHQDVLKLMEDLKAAYPVFLLSKSTCPFCKRAKILLNGLEAKFTTIELDPLSPEEKLIVQTHMKETTGAGSVPRVFIGGHCIGGFSETQRNLWMGELVPRLEKVGAVDAKALGSAGHFDAGNPLL
mmetsp:Transcript_13310/g.20191  ORF Transcript_13310/g.20191 Transcript_13310/m.20191 type:complete len:200 (+) Transcript_13310:61-660(+)